MAMGWILNAPWGVGERANAATLRKEPVGLEHPLMLMANRIKVAIVDSILTLRQQGRSLLRIARTLGLDRATVGRYVRRGEAVAKYSH